MRASPGALRYPARRVLLARTKLAYIHLGNLLSDAKRDRTARVSGYVAIWLPEEFLLLFLRDGELVNAARADQQRSYAVAISEALASVPAAPEFGEVCFHEAPEQQLACMHRSLVAEAAPWPAGLGEGDASILFPHLRSQRFDGFIEVIAGDSANYLVMRDGLIDASHVAEGASSSRSEQLARLFGPPSSRPRAKVRQFAGPLSLPSQAAPGLIAAYRDLATRLFAELQVAGVPVPSAVGERVRHALLAEHPVLTHFETGDGSRADPPSEREVVTAAVAAWLTETLREALDGDDAAAERALRAAARERRHMLQASGLLGSLPWTIEW